SNIAIASRYSELVEDKEIQQRIFERIRREWQSSIEVLLKITGQKMLLERNPQLERSIRNRFPYLDPLNHVQVELLKAHRKNSNEQILRGVQ
ncbi:phosphoenolpyruvate carboxylase, partial [Klebsiella pneumoniae]|uniref:phosphoenolpyruvate carboxylase n=1 Tax=Klebsiella pneumoniae TaxID=573 RepID=UPI0013D608EC